MSSGPGLGVDLYWLPLGARGHCLRIGGNGLVFPSPRSM
jgi:hypothetical protein